MNRKEPIVLALEDVAKELFNLRKEALLSFKRTAELDDYLKKLDDLRLETLRIKRLVQEKFGSAFDEKTPVRPPSQQAMEAFRLSTEFLNGTKKR